MLLLLRGEIAIDQLLESKRRRRLECGEAFRSENCTECVVVEWIEIRDSN